MANPRDFKNKKVLLYWQDLPNLILCYDDSGQHYLLMRSNGEEIWYIEISEESADKLLKNWVSCPILDMFVKSETVYTFNVNQPSLVSTTSISYDDFGMEF